MKRLKKMPKLILLSAISAIAFGGIAAGSTYALFTSSAETKTTVTAGKVDVSATITDLVTYSGTDLTGVVEDDTSKIKPSTELGLNNGDFINGGTAKLTSTGNLELDKMTPGDKVSFKIVIQNKSSVKIKYRTKIMCNDDTGLFDGLKITVNSNTYEGITTISKYQELDVGASPDSISITIDLPTDAGDDYKGTTCTIENIVEAVQANAKTSDPQAGVFEIYTATDLKYLQKHASEKFGIVSKTDEQGQSHEQNNDYLTVSLMNDLDLKDATILPINVRKITFNGNKHTIKNFNIDNTPSSFASDYDKFTGLFGDFSCSTVSDLYVDNANIKGTNGVGGIAGVGLCSSFINCKVTNSKIVAQDVNKVKDGDKVGSIVGRLSGEPEGVIQGCEASNNTIQGYRDVGGLAGMVGFYDNQLEKVVVRDNKVSNIKIINDRSYDYNNYKTSDSSDGVTEIKNSKANVDAIVGRKDAHQSGQKFVLDETSNTSKDIEFRMQYEDGLSTLYKIEKKDYNVYDYEVSNGNGFVAWGKNLKK